MHTMCICIFCLDYNKMSCNFVHKTSYNVKIIYVQLLDKLLARQFLLSPWLKEKRLRNQLRLVLKVSQQ